MKRLVGILASLLFLLAGCLNPVAVRLVEDMYTQALIEEEQAMEMYYSEEFLQEQPLESFSDELAEHVRHVGGVPLLNAVELTRNQLNPEIADALDGKYGDDWSYVVNDADKGYLMAWVVKRTSGIYKIIEAEKITVDHYHDYVRK